MPTEAIPCPFCGCVQRTPAQVEAYVEKMLDAADRAPAYLGELEQCRRKLVRDEADLEHAQGHTGPSWRRRRRELEDAIELGVDMLARAFTDMASLVSDGSSP
jgi:hypothetical protein